MIDVHALIAVSLICAAGVMSPGPNFPAVAQRAPFEPAPKRWRPLPA